MDIEVDSAWEAYQARFNRHFGEDKLPGAYVKFGKHMVQRLDRETFAHRLKDYVSWHRECKAALDAGTTISDALVLEFEEAAAWLALEPPNLLDLFKGELGDPLAT